MKVKDLRVMLEDYTDEAEVVIVDWSSGNTFEPTIGGDDEDEGEKFCRIGF